MKKAGKLNQNDPIDIETIKTTSLYKELIKILKSLDILREDETVMKVSDLDAIIDVIQIEKFKKGDVVFNYGDAGDKFYIILGGETSINLPNTEEIENWKERYNQYLLLLEEIRQRDIHNRKELLVSLREQELSGVKKGRATEEPRGQKNSFS